MLSAGLFVQAQTRLDLTANECFFTPVGTLENVADPEQTGSAANNGIFFTHVTNWRVPTDTIVWAVDIAHAGQLTITPVMGVATNQVNSTIDIVFGGQVQTRSLTQAGGYGSFQAQPSASFEVSVPGRYLVELTLNTPVVLGVNVADVQKLELTGTAAEGASVVIRRWRPLAIHGRWESSGNPEEVVLAIHRNTIATPHIDMYQPITTPFGYYGSTWRASSRRFNEVNFSLWSYGQNDPIPPIEELSHLIAVGPGLVFGEYGHEGTGVKPRGDSPYLEHDVTTQVLALRMEPGEYYDTYYAYYLDPETEQWGFWGAGKKYNDRGTIRYLTTGAFVEQPGVPARQRSNHVMREVHFGGWLMDKQGQWYNIDRMVPGGSLSTISFKNWGVTEENEFYMQMGGFGENDHQPNLLELDGLPPVDERPVYLQPEILEALYRLPATIDTLAPAEVGATRVVVQFDIADAGTDAVAELFWGTSEGLTFDYEWAYSREVEIAQGVNEIEITGLTPNQQYHYRLRIANAEGTTWSMHTQSFATAVDDGQTHAITFQVTDSRQQLIPDAVVTFNGIVNTPGEYVFADKQSGTYQYQIQREGFHDVTGELTIFSDSVVPVSMISKGEQYPVIWLKFDGSLDNDGTVQVSPEVAGNPQYTTGPAGGQAYVFDGGNALNLPGYTGINGAGARTVALWVQTTQDASIGSLVHWGETGTNSRSSFRVQGSQGGHVRYEWHGGGRNSSTKVNDGQWHHVAYTYDSEVLRLYVNGQEEASANHQLASGNAGETNVEIGAQLGAFRFIGSMADLRIYDAALDAEEILELASGSETYRVSFNIMDQQSQALPGASIRLGGIENAPGHYVFEGVAPGAYSFRVEKSGYFPYSGEINVSADTSIDVLLTSVEDAQPEIWLRFQENLLNSGSVDVTPVSAGSPQYAAGPDDKKAFVFDGENDISLPGYTGISGSGSRTVALWMKTTGNTRKTMVSWGTAVNFSRSTFALQPDGFIRFEWAGGGVNGSALVNDGHWHHVAYTYDGNTVSLYVNGTLEATHNISLQTAATDVQVGRQGTGNPFTGYMSDVRIYNVPLGEEQIMVLAEGGEVPDPYIVSVAEVGDIEMEHGTAEADALAGLASTTTITDSRSDTHTVELNWTIDSYDGNTSGEYTATGVFELPSGVEQSDPPTALEVTAKVTVLQEVVYIVSVAEVEDIEVEYGTAEADALAGLASTTTITDSRSDTHTVELNWTIDSYDGNTSGEYSATGVFELPSGVQQSDPPIALEVTATVKVLQEVVYIVSVAEVEDIEVEYGTAEADALAGLAFSTTITDSRQDTHTVELNWTIDSYDGNTAGEYTATGAFELPSGVEQSDPPTVLEVTATVTVLEEEVFIVSVAGVENIEVEHGTAEADALAGLASTTTITDSRSDTHTVELNWTIASYDGSTAGEYTATGAFELPSGVEQSDPPTALEVTAKVTVLQEVVYIVSVAEVEDIEVEYGTAEADALAGLASSTTITDSRQDTHTVELTWTITDYDSGTSGEYAATGAFELPSGVEQSDPPTVLEVTATVTVLEEEVFIVSVAGVENIEVEHGTAEADALAGLASTTTITDSRSDTHTVELNWTIASYDGSTAGEYTATGAFELPSGVEQSDPPTALEVTAKVTVLQEVVYIVSVAEVEDIEVEYGTAEADALAGLASSTTITDSRQDTHTVELTWTITDYDSGTSGEYAATGAFELPSGVEQSDPPTALEVTAMVRVLEEVVYIVSVAEVEDIEVEYGTAEADALAGLASSTTITDSRQDTHTVELNWTIASYDGNTAGEYTATGAFELPSGVQQSDPPTVLEVTATVTVLKADDVSVPEKEQLVMALYPNPVRNTLNISSNLPILEIRILNMWGQVVYEAVVGATNWQWQVSGQRPGTYFVQVTTRKGTKIKRVQVSWQ
jgi:predicted RecA/RadA family phage recombinase